MRNVQKALRFPLGGIAKNLSYRDTTYPSEESVYSTPMAVNVIGECSFSSRLRGGSRPGLAAIPGGTPVEDSSMEWRWPNGEKIIWNSSVGDMLFVERKPPTMPDGAKIVEQHETLTVKATKGAVPDNVTTAAMYRGRLVVAKDAMWYASRTGDCGNFDYGGEAEDVTRAVAGSLAFAGRTGENITALMPFGDARLFIATARRIAVISEEPTGGIATLSENVGVISRDAWCNADGVLYFIGENGMYAVGDGRPMSASSQIPESLKGLDEATLVYDPERNGIHIFASCTIGQTTVHADYFYDIGNKAFWPVIYPTAIRPLSGGALVIDGVNRVAFRCTDGGWRYWDESSGKDDNTDISSKVAIGPFKLGNDDVDGMLDKVTATFGGGSADVDIEIYTAKSAEEAYDAALLSSPEAEFTAKAGWNCNIHTRVRGAWCVIVLTSGGRWAYESILARIKTLGGLRNG